MFKELSELSVAHLALVVVAFVALCAMLTVAAWVAAVQWRRVQQSEQEYVFKNALLERGLSVEQVERLLVPAKPEPPAPAPVPPAEAKTPPPQVVRLEPPRQKPKSRFMGYYIVTALFVISVIAVANNPARHAPESAKVLVPDRPQVLLTSGGSGSCRVYIDGADFFPIGARWNAVVLSRSNRNASGELKVEAIAPKPTTEGPTPNFCDVQVNALSGSGEYTVQVSAIDLHNRRAETTFRVQVKAPSIWK
jgi:hypothetical protein